MTREEFEQELPTIRAELVHFLKHYSVSAHLSEAEREDALQQCLLEQVQREKYVSYPSTPSAVSYLRSRLAWDIKGLHAIRTMQKFLLEAQRALSPPVETTEQEHDVRVTLLAPLEPLDRDILYLHYVEEYTIQETADKLGKSYLRVRDVLLPHAKAQLKLALGRSADGAQCKSQ